MKDTFQLKREDGQMVEAKFKTLGVDYLPKIMELQEMVVDGLEDKQLYVASNEEEFRDFIEGKGEVVGCVTLHGDELIAMGVYGNLKYEKSNYGYDLDFSGEELLKVGQIETTIVREDFRGNRLQKRLCEILEQVGKENNTPIITATASPYNKFSVNTFISLGYEIVKDKIKYGGLRRYVLMKDLNK